MDMSNDLPRELATRLEDRHLRRERRRAELQKGIADLEREASEDQIALKVLRSLFSVEAGAAEGNGAAAGAAMQANARPAPAGEKLSAKDFAILAQTHLGQRVPT